MSNNSGPSKRQRDKQRLKDIKEGHPFLGVTRKQAAIFRSKKPEEVYADSSLEWRR